MELAQLLQFKQIAEKENMTQASNNLYVAQSSLSKSLKRLEQELSAELFDREGRGMRLNDYGRTALSYVQLIADDMEKIQEAVRSFREEQRFSVYTSHFSIANYVFPQLCSAYPDICINASLTAYNLRALLLDGTCDLAITPYRMDGDGVESTFLFTDQVLVSVPESNPLSRLSQIDLSDLEEQTFVETKRGNPMRIEFPNPLNKNMRIRCVYKSNLDTVYDFAQQNEYLYFTDTVASPYLQKYGNRRLIPFTAQGYTYPFYISFLIKSRKKVAFLANWLRDYFGATDGPTLSQS